MFPKNAAKLHFLFHLAKYLSRNSRKYSFFFHSVKSACQISAGLLSFLILQQVLDLVDLLRIKPLGELFLSLFHNRGVDVSPHLL